MFIRNASRGQTLIETIIALPIVLLVIFGILYVARVGVVGERAQLALRYGGIAGFIANSSAYSAANIYENLDPSSIPQPCPTPAAGAFSDSAPFPGPSSAPFWQPDSIGTGTPCQPAVFGLGGAQFLASHFFSATSLSVSAGIDVPAYLQSVLGTSSTVAAAEAFVHPAFPGMILYCSTEVRNRAVGAITAQGSNIPPTPIPNGASNPSPAPNNNGVCR
ncbi:MAG TPA: TadE family protein [Candidatus Aquilonibacter sp.]|nr:TadE family protein [Candidatus Aquilonibacter sp.]